MYLCIVKTNYHKVKKNYDLSLKNNIIYIALHRERTTRDINVKCQHKMSEKFETRTRGIDYNAVWCTRMYGKASVYGARGECI